MNSFFVSCPLGFEKELIQEIENFWFQLIDLDGLPTRSVFPEFTVYSGGVEFKIAFHLGLQINFFSRLALRVLLRIGSFEARYFDQFEKGLKQVELGKYLHPQSLNIQIESAKSRLFHEGNLLESATKCLAQQKYIYDENADMSLFLRINKDRVTVSLDTSGEHLHFRGYRQSQGEAPLRENLASLILQLAQVGSEQIFDPYCGSGTFFFEAQLKNASHFERPYSFLKFKNLPALFKSEAWKKNYRWVQWSEKNKCIGIEKNPKTFEKALANKEVFEKMFGTFSLKLVCEDSEKIKEFPIDQPTTLVTNPPYGERSAAGDVVAALNRWEINENIKKIVVLHPDQWTFSFQRLKLVKQVPLSNQGLKTSLSIFQ